jgi:hypothetical protein
MKDLVRITSLLKLKTLTALCLILMSGLATISFGFAHSPNYPPCNYTYTITYYDSPSNAGTISAGGSTYSSGQDQIVQENNVPCSDNHYSEGAQANPSSGYVFYYWSKSGMSLTSNSTNPTDFTMSPGYASITANYDFMGQLYEQWTQAKSGNNPSSSSPNALPNSGGSNSPPCNLLNGNKFSGSNWWLYVCTGKESGLNAVEMAFSQDGGNGWSGNVTIAIQLLNNASKTSNWVGTISLNYESSSGSIIHMGDEWLQNYTTSLSNQLNNLQNNIGFVYPAYELNGNSTIHNLGLSYNWIYYGLQTMTNAINSHGYGSYNVQTMGAMTGQYILSSQCQFGIDLALVGGAAGLIDLIFAAISLSTYVAFGVAGLGLLGGCG